MPNKQFILNIAYQPNLSTPESFVMDHNHLNVNRDSGVPIISENAVDHDNHINFIPPQLFSMNASSPHLIHQIH